MTALDVYKECGKHTVCVTCKAKCAPCEKFCKKYNIEVPELISTDEFGKVQIDKEVYE